MTAAANGALTQPERTQRATCALAATLQRISALHAELADAYTALAIETGAIPLAEPADPSVTAAMTTGFHPAAPEPREFLTQVALAAMLDTHPRTVRRMELEGELPAAIEIGRLKRWRRAEIQGWLDDGCPKPRRARR